MSIKFEPLPKLPLPIDSLIVHYIVSTNLVPSHNRGMRFNNLEKTWKTRWEETTPMCCASTNLRNFTTHKNCGIAPSAGKHLPPHWHQQLLAVREAAAPHPPLALLIRQQAHPWTSSHTRIYVHPKNGMQWNTCIYKYDIYITNI